MDAKRKLGLIFVFMTAPALALAQEDGGSGGSGGHGGESGGGCGDVFGDLVHILRDPTTGQPILQKRRIEDKGQMIDGFCPIPVNASGEEIGFAPISCDALDADAVVEVDYFGRLSGGRTKERNSRMHFDEVISSIKDEDVDWVGQDETGRLQLGYECDAPGSAVGCDEFRIIDSPMENLALYTRLMKYGHFQTDPGEVDTWSHGDPALQPQYHPALTATEHAKFDEEMRNLLAGDDNNLNENEMPCIGEGANLSECAAPVRVEYKDFRQAASFLGAASGKTGKITVDLVQYLNRILKITRKTEMSAANVKTLPALIRDCGEAANAETFPSQAGVLCTVQNATTGMLAPADERFVDFDRAKFSGKPWRAGYVTVLQEDGGTWGVVSSFPMEPWLIFVNGDVPEAKWDSINSFVRSASDALRAIEFVHNYAVPDDLWTLYLNKQE
jgi:hypothetical protein